MKITAVIFLIVYSLTISLKAAAESDVRIYRLDCGTMHLGDLTLMSDSGEYQGQSYDIVISCYLIKYEDKWLIKV